MGVPGTPGGRVAVGSGLRGSALVMSAAVMVQPLDPERAMDSMIWRWKTMKTISTGSSAMNDAAMISG